MLDFGKKLAVKIGLENFVMWSPTACISEHPEYGSLLEDITENLHNAKEVADFVSESSFEIGAALELDAMGVGAKNDQAFPVLIEAGCLRNKHDMNIEKLNDELSKNQSNMAQLEWYKLVCKDRGYYDSFKEKHNKRDIDANLFRERLERFWDKMVDKVEKHQLPGDLQTQNKWINAGNAYRKLVEPLDIAHNYSKHKGNENHVSEWVRPHRHMVLEKWLKEKNQTRTGRAKQRRTKFASLTEDSCFWAHVEEACKNLQQVQAQHQVVQAQQLQERLKQFEDYVGNLIKDKSISAEIFLEGSSFMKWWHQYRTLQLESPGWKARSPLFNFIANEEWK
ncbi:hypothetical protein KI387_008609 [Taxus chinensis]|uniref:EDS1 EP domain-containing protein n=1 Tax=Taxus chinensis TaxID=29808 RepID=A0AA38CPR1_TAXCH|nr:hypothetical protein KI387_008609 [Taxus chinensis]